MKALNSLVHHVLLSWLVVLGLAVGCSACDTKWIRMVYMLSCGKKKREYGVKEAQMKEKTMSLPFMPRNSSRSTEGIQSLGRTLLRAAIGEKDFSGLASHVPEPAVPALLSVHPNVAFSGMRGSDSLWILEDLMGDFENNEVHRREIEALVHKCCQVPPTSCSAKDFVGACK